MEQALTERLAGYQAVHEAVGFFRHLDAGYLRLTGEDRIAFLQRQTTNDVTQLSPERAVLTVLTSPTARILDVLLLVAEPEAIGVITLPGRAAITARYLQGKIFFMDKVTVTDESAAVAQFDVEGTKAADFLRRLGLERIPALDEVVSAHIDDVTVRVIGQQGLMGAGYRLLASAETADALAAALVAAGAVELSAESYEVLRVEAGLPGPQTELTEEYNPLETNLQRAISETKGCYTGQEVIARQITYDKVTRRLVGLRLEAPVAVGARVLAEGKPAGTVTSAAISPRYGPIALAVIKRPYNQPGTLVHIAADAGEIPGEVTTLPLHKQPKL